MEIKVVTEDYRTCIEELEQKGFVKYVDNGENGLGGNVFTTTLTKNNLAVTVIHIVKIRLTYIVSETVEALSERLFYNKNYVAENIAGARTTLHMRETYRPGSSYVLQLKNQHFVMCDGGYLEEAPHLIAYLESLVPKGTKPVIEGWFITHPHHDHMEMFQTIANDTSLAERIYVDGIYMDMYDDAFAEKMNITSMFDAMRDAAAVLKSTDGEITKIYRPHAGQRYYFSDITVDVMQTMVQVPRENWNGWRKNLNEMSAWYMFNIEGQKYLNAGDADLGAMRAIMSTYDKEYLDMDIMVVQHHGINVHKEFTDFIKVKTLLYPYLGIDGVFAEGQDWPGSWQASVYRNEYLHSKVEECLSYGDGTKVLTFPYEVGTAVSLPLREDHFEFTGEAKERRINYKRGGVR